MTVRRPLRKPLLAALLALLSISAMTSNAAAAQAANPIEGVWSFTGGAVAVQAGADDTFQGTVVSPTQFATCVHAAGELMWTQMRPQADGSFWGLHQWFSGGDKCEANPTLGLTAWRVIAAADGSRYLLVCFSTPGDASQPTIAPNGAASGATYGCSKSSPLASLPATGKVGGFDAVISLPATKACVRRRSLKVLPRNPKYDPLKQVVVRVNGKKVADVTDPGRLKKAIRLTRLPQGTYRVNVVAITVLNERITGGRTYRACVKGPGKIRV